MKIYIVGSGGVGGYFGGKLAKAGNDVTFLARGEHFNAIKNFGLIVNNTDEDFVVKPTQVIENISEIKDPDLILFSVKTYDTKEVAKELKKVVTANTIIITFQNGIYNDIEISKIIDTAAVYPGLAYVISAKIDAGIISQTGGLKKLIFGDRYNTNNSKLEKVETIFLEAGIDTLISDDIKRDLWGKYIFINAFSGMTALCRSNIGKIRSDKEVYDMYKDCVKESIKVSKKIGVNLPDTIFDDVMNISNNTHPNSKSSLLVDIENKKKTEIDALNGTLFQIAKKYNISVPINRVIYNSIKLLSES